MARNYMRGCVRQLVAGVFALFLAGLAAAQAWPAKPIRIVVPFPPGDSGDVLSRLIAPRLAERLGQPVIVENRPGAAGTIGMEYISKAAPDGYTIGAGQNGTLAVIPNTRKQVNYNPLKDFEFIAAASAGYMGIVVSPNAPFNTFPEMVAWARANPGKLTVASNGDGGFPHLNFEQIRLSSNFTFTHVPFAGGGGPILTAVAGGQVMAAVGATGSQAGLIRGGKIRLLAVTSPKRLPSFPDAPAVSETLPGFEASGWFGFIAPAGVPRSIIVRLNEEINRALNLPEVRDKLLSTGLDVGSYPPEFWAEHIRSEHAKYARVVKAIGFQPE
jgi:tripartite-type tricarboxylate transporter receptor subunit TctC